MSATMDRRAPGKRPDRRKAPKLRRSQEPRMTELIGLTDDGRMVLWDTGMVQPADRFEVMEGGWIESGHYVIEWKGHAITVHCGNHADGSVSVQFMCRRGWGISIPREAVESMLIGKVIRDPKAQARIGRLLEKLREAVAAHQDTPERQRGRIAKPTG